MHVALLGPLEVSTSTGPRPVAGGRLRALLTRLAVAEGRVVTASELVDAVWPDAPPAGGANALQSLVSRLRRALGDPEAVQQVATGYRLAVTADDLDTTRFGALVRSGQRQLAGSRPEAAVTAFDEALALWRAEPLSDAGDADYAPAYRSGWQALRLRAEEDRLAALLAAGRFDDAVTDAEALTRAHPLNERIALSLLRALTGAGRAPEALTAYEAVRRRLREALGTDPGPELRAEHLRLLRGEPGTGPVPTAAAAPTLPTARRSNLRAALTSFVGREDDVQRVLTGLRTHRLTTVIGTGGCGKTRLAVEVGRRWLAADDEASVWLVELAPVTGADDLVTAVLGALGVRDTRVTDRTERPLPDARERLLDRLRDSRCLLVMDNCEHLIDPVAQLVDDLLAAAPHVRVLATSRELLGLTGELLCAIAPLPLPPLEVNHADVDLADALAYPSVRLWLDRATAVQPTFVLDAETLPAVIEIVRRLDGLPLAIELAAARLRVLPVGEIAQRLSDRFRLLTGGNRTSLPRHRTLRAVVEWSWDLLGPAERLLAERLSVFPAGADADSARTVCAGGLVAAADVDDLLGSLVDKSLLQTEAPRLAVPTAVRYRMLETIREYGIERLGERDELAAARLAHAEHYLAVVLECEPVLRSRAQLTAMARLDLDRDNVYAALRYLLDSGRGDQALTMLLALAWYWSMLDNTIELAGWAGPVVAANAGSGRSDLAYARAAVVMGELSDDAEAAADRLSWEVMRERLAAVSAELADTPPPPFPGLEVLRAMIASFSDRPADVEASVARALAADDRWLHAALQASLAGVYENAGELEQMRTAVETAYAEFVGIGDRWGLSTTLVARGQLATTDGRLDDAIADYQEARGWIRELGASGDDAFISVRLGDLLIRRGDFGAAREEIGRLSDTRGRGPEADRALFGMAASLLIEWHTGHPDRAFRLAEQIRAELDGKPASQALVDHLRGMLLATTGLISALAGQDEIAAADLRTAYPSALQTHDQPIIAAVGNAVAGWLAARGRHEESAVVLGAAAAVRGADDPTDRAVVTVTELLRPVLGERFALAYGTGRALDRAEAQRRLDPERYL